MYKLKLFIFVLLLLAGILTVRHSSKAKCCCGDYEMILPPTTECTDLNSKCEEKDSCDGKTKIKKSPPVFLENFIKIPEDAKGKEVQYLIGQLIKVIMGLVGSFALLMFVYGGLLWMTSAGNEDRVAKGKHIFVWATAGLAVIFSSYILVHFILSSLMGLS